MTTVWLEFHLHLESPAEPLPALQVPDVDGVGDPRLRDAVLAHAAPRWAGAPLTVRVSPQTMRGRILAAHHDGPRRPVATFTIAEQAELDCAVPAMAETSGPGL